MQDVSTTIFLVGVVVSCWSGFLLRWPAKWRGWLGLAFLALAAPFLFVEVEAPIDPVIIAVADIVSGALLMFYGVLALWNVPARGDRPRS